MTRLTYITAAIIAATLFNATSIYAQTAPDQADTGMSLDQFEKTVMGLPVFSEVIKNWKKKSQPGNIAKNYKKIRTLKTYPKGEQVVFPKKGDVIVYQLTGTSYNNPFQRKKSERITSKGTRIFAIDAKTKKVLAWKELPLELKGNPHTTPVSPDGKYIYAAGPPLTNFEQVEVAEDKSGNEGCTSPVCKVIPTTLVKIDALTLQPVKVMTAPGRLHHGHIFRDKYMLFDSFAKDPDGVDTYLLDPKTDQVIAGMRNEELGGSTYTVWRDHQDEYIYQFMEPSGYTDKPTTDGYLSAHWVRTDGFTALRPSWLTKIKVSKDLKKWEVVKEYPFFGNRGNWVEVSPDQKYMYINSAGMNITQKIDMETGRALWSTPVGDGPYGNELTPDGKELWVLNKGETTGMWGHDIHVINTITGMRVGLINTGFTSDHIILSPNGREMWVSSNGTGKLYVYEIASRQEIAVIPLPGYGDPHGLPFVYYYTDKKAKVVVDQNGFHNGYDAQMGKPLEYDSFSSSGDTVKAASVVTPAPEQETANASGKVALVPTVDGNVAKGKEAFQSPIGCQVCHGMDAKGAIGPNIRQTSLERVYHAVQSFNDMIAWKTANPALFVEKSLKNITAYLQTLPKE